MVSHCHPRILSSPPLPFTPFSPLFTQYELTVEKFSQRRRFYDMTLLLRNVLFHPFGLLFFYSWFGVVLLFKVYNSTTVAMESSPPSACPLCLFRQEKMAHFSQQHKIPPHDIYGGRATALFLCFFSLMVTTAVKSGRKWLVPGGFGLRWHRRGGRSGSLYIHNSGGMGLGLFVYPEWFLFRLNCKHSKLEFDAPMTLP